MVRLSSLAAIFLLLLIIYGCNRTSEEDGIDGEVITDAEFEAYLKLKRIPSDPGNRRNRALKTFLERNALAEAIAQDPLLDNVAIEAELRDFRNELLISRYFEAFLKEKVRDEAMKAYYHANIDKYTRQKVKIAQILFRTHRAMREQQKSAKFSEAVEAHAKLKGGTPFAKLARQLSEDTLTAKKGGEIGWLQEAQIDKAIFDKALSMKQGKISEPIETDRGYHIIKLLEGPIGEQRPFEEVKGEIRYRLRYEAKQAEMNRLLSEISIKSLE